MSYRVDLEPEDLRSVRRQGPGMRTAVGLLVAVLAAAGSWAGWRALHAPAPDAAIPVIRADTTPVKVRPADPGGLNVPDQNMDVLNHIDAPEPKVEQLLPPPETPLPRPAAAPAPTVTDLPAAPAAASLSTVPVAAPAAAVNAETLPVAPAVATAAAPAPVAAPAAAPAATPAATPAPVAPNAVVSPTVASAEAPARAGTPAAAGGWRLQLAALREERAAGVERERLKHAETDLLGSLDMAVVRADLGARGVFYRVEAGPIADEAAARDICAKLRERKVGCILVRP